MKVPNLFSSAIHRWATVGFWDGFWRPFLGLRTYLSQLVLLDAMEIECGAIVGYVERKDVRKENKKGFKGKGKPWMCLMVLEGFEILMFFFVFGCFWRTCSPRWMNCGWFWRFLGSDYVHVSLHLLSKTFFRW